MATLAMAAPRARGGWLARALPDLVLAAVVVGLFLLAPHTGNFAWSDAPRHALNGVFVKDLVAQMPIHDPAGWAYRYYAQYPALTILFYPPLFYVVSAPFYALLGVSETTALFVVMLHYLAFAWGALRLFRHWLPMPAALMTAVALVAAPEIAFWGRQVMLEVPALACLTWSAVAFTRYRRTGRSGLLWLAAALMVCAMYTKLNAVFLVAAYAGTLAYERRGALLRDRQVWLVAAASALALVPLLAMTIRFGQANLQSVTGIADAVAPRDSLAGWLWYARQMPLQLGWPVVVLAGLGVVGGLARFVRKPVISGDAVFWLLWALAGYLFFSSIALKEARHSVLILPPVVLLAGLALRELANRLPDALATVAWVALPGAVLAQTVTARPVEQVGGYAEAASFVAARAPQASRVLFSGYRDGSFTFAMRSHEERRDLGVVRADKLLLSVSVRRELGVTEKAVSDAELLRRFETLGIRYVVMQPGFWTDLPAMRRFEALLAGDRFEVAARIATPANYPAHEHGLVVYRYKGPIRTGSAGMTIDLPIIGRRIETR
ncbi:MAG: glycosyltransferase family 39 protein [Sphingomonadales bacterium]|nr:glycosyltransferase family 39 protein [Sphingomonadales bacterium]